MTSQYHVVDYQRHPAALSCNTLCFSFFMLFRHWCEEAPSNISLVETCQAMQKWSLKNLLSLRVCTYDKFACVCVFPPGQRSFCTCMKVQVPWSSCARGGGGGVVFERLRLFKGQNFKVNRVFFPPGPSGPFAWLRGSTRSISLSVNMKQRQGIQHVSPDREPDGLLLSFWSTHMESFLFILCTTVVVYT